VLAVGGLEDSKHVGESRRGHRKNAVAAVGS
jgi:hypothetical protein